MEGIQQKYHHTGPGRNRFPAGVPVCEGAAGEKRNPQEKRELQNLKALIYFTDGDGIYPRQKPDYETAFVFLHKTEKMELVPPWAIRLVAEQEGVRYRT